MDWLKETITFGSGLLLGFVSGFVWPRLRDKISERKDRSAKAERKARVLKDLDAIASDVMAAVQVQPHGVQNKDKWVSRLQLFAKEYNDILGPLAGYVRRISYKIEDSTFDHETLTNPAYCCDEVEVDLALLKLCILPTVAREFGWDSGTSEREEKRLLEKIWINVQEVGLAVYPPGFHIDMTHEEQQQALAGWNFEKAAEEKKVQQLNQWYAKWKACEFRIDLTENLAMAPYVNHERKTTVKPGKD